MPSTMIEVETRPVRHEIRLRKQADGLPVIQGYAAVYDRWSEDLGGFREIIRPGAFTKTLERGDDVRALVDHDPGKIIGRLKAGTLQIRNTAKGLRVEIKPGDTTAGKDVVESIRRGDLDGMSFAFRTISDRWGTENGEQIRELLEVDLRDVSVVAFPAYPSTEVAIRRLDILRKGAAPPLIPGLHDERLRLAEVDS